MKKISKSAELLWVFGIIFVAFGVALCNKADLGVSMIAAPTFVIYEAISPLFDGFSAGMVEYMIQGLLIIILCIVLRRFKIKYLLTFAVAVIYGYVLNLFLWLLGSSPFSYVWMRWVMLILGDLLTAFGVACFFRTYMPLQAHELFVSELSAGFRLNINKTKGVFDVALLVISILLAVTLFGDVKSISLSTLSSASFHSIGLGTLVTTVINSPLIALMGKLLDKIFDPTPRFPKLKRFILGKSEN